MQIVLGWSAALVLGMASPPGGGILASLPDPMRPDPWQIGFVMAVIFVLFLFLKHVFFRPITALMDQRDRDIAAGAEARSQVAALAAQRQADHDARTRALRQKAAGRRKELAELAQGERAALLLRARTEATAARVAATRELEAWRAEARRDLEAQVDALADTLTHRLIGPE